MEKQDNNSIPCFDLPSSHEESKLHEISVPTKSVLPEQSKKRTHMDLITQDCRDGKSPVIGQQDEQDITKPTVISQFLPPEPLLNCENDPLKDKNSSKRLKYQLVDENQDNNELVDFRRFEDLFIKQTALDELSDASRSDFSIPFAVAEIKCARTETDGIKVHQFQCPINSDNLKRSIDRHKNLRDQNLENLLNIADIILKNQVQKDLMGLSLLQGNFNEQLMTPVSVQNAESQEEAKRNEQFSFELVDMDNHHPILKQPVSDQSPGKVFMQMAQIYTPSNYCFARKQGNRYYCNQQMLKRKQSDGSVIFHWSMFNIDPDHFYNNFDLPLHHIQSGIFDTSDDYLWIARFEPGLYPNYNNTVQQKPSHSKFCLVAIPTIEERERGAVKRRIRLSLSFYGAQSLNKTTQKDFNQIDLKFEGDGQSQVSQIVDKFYQFLAPKSMKQNSYGDLLQIEFQIQEELWDKVQQNYDYENESENRKQPFKGLVNEGTTCYINSLIQTLFFIRPFRNAIFKMPTIQNYNNVNEKQQQLSLLSSSIPFCLQRIFYNLQEGKESSVRTFELLKAFGWSYNERNQQQDVDEFNRKLSDQLESQMVNTEAQGIYKRLFEGKYQSVIKCLNVDFESSREEKFNTLSLTINGNKNIESSIRQYLESEYLNGGNQYQTEKYGLQDAKKFIRFIKLPPVMQIQLNRYDYDFQSGNLIKNNQKFDFGEILDLESLLGVDSQETIPKLSKMESSKQEVPQSQQSVQQEDGTNRYHLHSILIHRGQVNFGHYYAFIRPNLDNKWYEFNDKRVEEVSKTFAFNQGSGGFITQFNLFRFGQKEFPLSQQQMREKIEESITNAYMLIYVRESDRNQILVNDLPLEQQIPIELQVHFKIEERYKEQIVQDLDCYTNNNRWLKCYVVTHETMRCRSWGGAMLVDYPGDQSERNQRQSYHLLRVEYDFSVNDFISELKERFFKYDNNIELEDIWIYRIVVERDEEEGKISQRLFKYTYDLSNWHDFPLFSNKPDKQLLSRKMGNNRWKIKHMDEEILVYLAINPLKSRLNSQFNPEVSILKILSLQEIQDMHCHYQDFIDQIHNSGLYNAKDCMRMYQEFRDAAYQFHEYPRQPQIAGQIAEIQKTVYESPISKTPSSYVLEYQNEMINKFRKHFVFELTEASRLRQRRLFEMFKKELERGMLDLESPEKFNEISQYFSQQSLVSPNEEQPLDQQELVVVKRQVMYYAARKKYYQTKNDEIPKLMRDKILVFVKLINTKDKDLEYKGYLFLDPDEPLKITALYNLVSRDSSNSRDSTIGIDDSEITEGRQLFVYCEPASDLALKDDQMSDINQESYQQSLFLEDRKKILSHENCQDLQFIRLNLDFMEKIPSSTYISEEGGLILNVLVSDQSNISLQEANQQYSEIYLLQTLKTTLTLSLLEDSGSDEWTKRELGLFEYNYHESFTMILQRTQQYLKKAVQNPIVDHIQLFDSMERPVTFSDQMKLPQFSNEAKSLKYLINERDKELIVCYWPIPIDKLHNSALFQPQILLHQRLSAQSEFESMIIKKNEYIAEKVNHLIRWMESKPSYQKILHIDPDTQLFSHISALVDRKTGAIIQFVQKDLSFVKISVDSANWRLPPFLRIYTFPLEERVLMKRWVQEYGEQDLAFGVIQLKKQRTQEDIPDQFVVPFSRQSSTINQLFEMIQKRIHNLHFYNQIQLQSLDFELHYCSYDQSVCKNRGGRQKTSHTDYQVKKQETKLLQEKHGSIKFGKELIQSLEQKIHLVKESPIKLLYFDCLIDCDSTVSDNSHSNPNVY